MGAKISGSAWSDDMEQKNPPTATNPSCTKRSNPSCNNNYKFILKDQTADNITRLNYDREMLVGIWSKGLLGHSSIFICYFSKLSSVTSGDAILAARLFCIELFVKPKTKENILSIKGPIYNTRDYNCKQFYATHTNMEQIIEIAKDTTNNHGKYGYWTNNCKHWCEKCLINIKKTCIAIKMNASCDSVNQYIQQYGGYQQQFPADDNTPDDKVDPDNNYNTPDDKVDPDNNTPGDDKIMTRCNPTDDRWLADDDVDVETLSIVQVLQQFPLDQEYQLMRTISVASTQPSNESNFLWIHETK